MRQILVHFSTGILGKLEHCRKLNKVTFFLLLVTLSMGFFIISSKQTVNIHPEIDSIIRNQILLQIPECQCEKYVPFKPQNSQNVPQNGTCSWESWDRGPGQKIVGFTYYEPIKEENGTENKAHRNYLEGLIENIQLVKEKYGPEYTVRLYYHVNKTSPVMKKLCDLACHEPNLDLCDATKNPRLGDATLLYPLIWRFLPVIDVNVDLFFSRDLDSRISDREVRLVIDGVTSALLHKQPRKTRMDY